MKKISVIIPAYNVAPYIGATLESVFAQTFRDFEVVVVNDGSPDTADFEREIAPFRDKIIYLKKENGGAASARNAGIRAACGEFVAFLDGDDVWLPEFLEAQLEFLEQNNLEMVYADAEFFGGDNPHGGKSYMQIAESVGELTTVSLLDWTCNVITSGTIVRREKIVAAGLFDESPAVRRGQDYEMWFRLLKTGAKAGYQRRVLLKYRVRKGSLSGGEVEQAGRNVAVLSYIEAKFDFTPAEKNALDKQLALSRALLHLETGKVQILKGDFSAARENFTAANRFYHKPKLYFIGLLLRIAPRFLQFVFQRHLNQNSVLET